MIRPATPSDLPTLSGLQALLPRPSPELLARATDGPVRTFVSVDGGDPVGYVLGVPGADAAHVAELVVAPDRRREGRGRALVSHLLASFARDGAARATVAVAPANEAARRLYESVGFEPRERVADYYDGDPAVLLERSL